jgi:hypothetical protein
MTVMLVIMEFTYYPYDEKFVEKVDERWGVYTLADRSKRVVFIGRGNVKKHLLEHLPHGRSPAEEAEFFQLEYFKDKAEAQSAWLEQVEAYQNKHGSLPKYNR